MKNNRKRAPRLNGLHLVGLLALLLVVLVSAAVNHSSDLRAKAEQELRQQQALERERLRREETLAEEKSRQARLELEATEKQRQRQRQEESRAALGKLELQARKWVDALNIAQRTSRIALSGPVKDLQLIKAATESLSVPACLESPRDKLIESMESYLKGFYSFMGDADFGKILAAGHFAGGEERFAD